MAIGNIQLSNSFTQLVAKTNLISQGLGDIATIPVGFTNIISHVLSLDSDIGDVSLLVTPADSFTDAINQLDSDKIGSLVDLQTTNQSSIVQAINENNTRIPGIYDTSGTLLNS